MWTLRKKTHNQEGLLVTGVKFKKESLAVRYKQGPLTQAMLQGEACLH